MRQVDQHPRGDAKPGPFLPAIVEGYQHVRAVGMPEICRKEADQVLDQQTHHTPASGSSFRARTSVTTFANRAASDFSAFRPAAVMR